MDTKSCRLVIVIFASVFALVDVSWATDIRLIENHSPVIDAINESYRNYHVQGEALADGSFRVLIITSDGAPLFESNYPVEKSGERYVEWTYHGESDVTRSNRVAGEMLPTLAGMTFAAKDIVRMMNKGYEPDSASPILPHDTWGCDDPFRTFQCTSLGNCCDTHDLCYAAFNCSALSWLGISSVECVGCNMVVIGCIYYGAGSTGQPSRCCALGNCGQERCPGFDYDNPNCIVVVGGIEPGGPLHRDQGGNGDGSGGGWWGTPDGSVTLNCSYDGGRTVFACKH